jgi:membrane associated rhomboid family serine protease
MSSPVKNIFALPKGMLLFLAINAVSFPAIWLEFQLTHQSRIVEWTGLAPALVWHGQVWRLASYALFAPGVLGWAICLFWLVTLTVILAHNWSVKNFWIFCLFTAIAGAVPLVLFRSNLDTRMFGAWSVIFGLLVAWDRLYRRERLVMLGLGEMTVRQAAIFIAVINGVIAFFSCGGWLSLLSMMCGAGAGWIYLALGEKRVMSRGSQAVESKRIARLEL